MSKKDRAAKWFAFDLQKVIKSCKVVSSDIQKIKYNYYVFSEQ